MSEEESQLDKLSQANRPKPHQLSYEELFGGSPQIDPTPDNSNLFRRGRLKIFLGAAAGVGKTYTMLEEAQQLRRAGTDVVIGYVEMHGRAETEQLLAGMEIVPRKIIEYRGATLEEMDTAAIIARRPQLALVDELAHTNPPGFVHAKRYEDIEDLLSAGIDVFSTVNVQHLESLNDRVFELTGTRVRETFPDRLFDVADEVVMIDLPPEDLRERLRQGKIYRADKVEQALQNFFKPSNLMVLRELALRETADAVESSAPHREYRALHEEEPPTVHAFVLICVALKAQDARVIRQGWRFARRLNAQAEVVNVSRDDERTIAQEEVIAPLRRLARALELPFRELKGEPVESLTQEARSKHATLLVLGESTRTTFRERLFGTFTDKILRNLDGIDIYIVGDPSRRLK